MKLVSIALALLMVTGCAATRNPLKADATVEDRHRSEVCHLHALEVAERQPNVAQAHLGRHWGSLFQPTSLAIAIVAAVTAPVWYPIVETKRNQGVYDAIYFRCMHPATDEALPGPTVEK